MKSFFLNLLFSLILGTLILFAFCSRDEPSRDIVAEVGKEKISRAEFDISFALNPQYAIRTPMRKARQSQIKFLVNEKYYYLASRKVELARDSVVQSRLSYIRDQEIIKAYLHKNFIDQVIIEDEKLLQAHSRLGLNVHVQHLFAETREAADSLWQLLYRGETFETLAKKIYRDSVLSETGGDLGFVGFGDMDPRLEDQVYAMKPGEVSRPVQSSYGYHILKVLEFQQNEQFLETPEE